MSDLVPMQSATGGRQLSPYVASQSWGEPPPEQPLNPGVAFGRVVAALKRYKWLVLAVIVLGSAGGAVALRFVKPKYTAQATVWISSETPLQENSGPIRSKELLNASAWVELLRSYRVTDAVVQQRSLFVKPARSSDSTAFANFSLAQRFAPGAYELELQKGGQYRLSLKGILVESGRVGDSIGRRVGFQWMPSPAALRANNARTVSFTVSTPRETSLLLGRRLDVTLPENSNFLWLSFEDEDPKRAAAVLNAWVNEYVSVAGELKKKNITEFANILGGQLAFAQKSLQDAEAALEGFRTTTITLPSENTPVAAGLELTRDPALNAYFERKIEEDNVRHDREALEALMKQANGDVDPLEAALLIPSVAQGAQGANLSDAFKRLYEERAKLAALRQGFTDEYKPVKDLTETVKRLESDIPRRLDQILVQLRDRESRTSGRIREQEKDLRQIPTRTIDEMRMRRRVVVAEGLYTTLQSRYAEARLAEASTNPDVRILDSAVAPLKPSSDTSISILGGAIFGSLAAAIALAMLLDRLDRRVRYTEHATKDLGLAILGTVPTLPKQQHLRASPESVAQVVEAFRSIRLNLVHAAGVADGTPLTVAVTSAGPGEGKSLVCANLALSFAEAGLRTVLVDGDTRRGALHSAFGVPMNQGLTDYLTGELPLEGAVHQTTHEGLVLMPRGSRRRRGPELLTSPAMVQLVRDLRSRADIVIFDTPPLAAGIDAFAIGTAAMNVVTVLRVGKTDRRLASAKLDLFDRLPARLLGAVLNDLELKGEFQYYSYLEGYYTDAEDEKPAGQLVAGD